MASHRVVIEVEYPAQHLGQLRSECTFLFTGAEDGADFLAGHREVRLARICQVTLTKQPEQAVGSMVHNIDERSHDGVHPVDGACDVETDRHGLVKGQHLRRQLAANHVHEGDDHECHDVGKGMAPVLDLLAVTKDSECRQYGRIENLGKRDYTDGAETQRDQRDADLGYRVEPLWLVMQYLHHPGRLVAGACKLFDATAPG